MNRITTWVATALGMSISLGASAQMPKAADRAHAETADNWLRTDPPLDLFFKLPFDYLDDKATPPHERLYLADTLPPVDLDNAGIRRMVATKDIQCPELTCTYANGGKPVVIGYNPRYYAALKSQVGARPLEPISPSGAIKVVGKWKDKYPVRAVVALDRPVRSGGKLYFDPFEVVAALTPVDRKDVRPVLDCNLLCADWDDGRVVGYDPVAWAKFKRMWALKPQAERDAFYRQIKDMYQREQGVAAEERAYADRQAEKQAWRAAYNPPPMKDPGTSSGVPTRVIREAITGDQANYFNLTTWQETNTYVLKRGGESVHYVEYQAQWDIKKEHVRYVNSGGGIDFRSPRMQTKGTLGMVKRGSSWYLVSK